MKNNLTSLLACAAAVNLTSCGGVGITDYLQCLITPGDCTTEECLIGKTIDAAVTQIMASLSEGVDTLEEAEDLADTMDSLLTAIERAKEHDIKVPAYAKETFNKALVHLMKNNYFGSEHLRIARKDAPLL